MNFTEHSKKETAENDERLADSAKYSRLLEMGTDAISSPFAPSFSRADNATRSGRRRDGKMRCRINNSVGDVARAQVKVDE